MYYCRDDKKVFSDPVRGHCSCHSRQCVGSTGTTLPVAARTHCWPLRRQGNTSAYASPFSITLSCRSRSCGALDMGCQSCKGCPIQFRYIAQSSCPSALRWIKDVIVWLPLIWLACDPYQQHPVASMQPQTRPCPPQGDAELMAEKQILGFEPASRLEPATKIASN